MAKEPKRLTFSQWTEAENLWARGVASLSELAEKYECDRATISRHMASAGIVKGSRSGEVVEAVDTAVSTKMKEDATLLAQRINDIKNDSYTRHEAIAKLAMNELAKARSANIPFASIVNNLKALNIAASIIEKTRIGSFEALGMNDENALPAELPELTFTIVDDEQIRRRVEANARALAVDDDIDLGEDEDDLVIEEGDED
jgi:DNA-binding transcriptional regulator YhcF (GntR family)